MVRSKMGKHKILHRNLTIFSDNQILVIYIMVVQLKQLTTHLPQACTHTHLTCRERSWWQMPKRCC
uniref:Uncharacterized protein n=1 Tax=Triticum urartu TaxID=4572 RepID=A0A8R7QL17_TRIUA